MKTERNANPPQEEKTLRQPIFDVLDSQPRSIDGVHYMCVKLLAYFPRSNGKWEQALVTVRLVNGGELCEALGKVLAFDEQHQLSTLAKEVEHG